MRRDQVHGEVDRRKAARARNEAAVHHNGQFVKPGAHVDLVGGFRPDMREADDDVIAQADVFVDFRDSAVDAGDIGQAITNGALALTDVKGDLFEMVRAAPKRSGKTTVFKNAGGAHLDLLVALAAARALGASL